MSERRIIAAAATAATLTVSCVFGANIIADQTRDKPEVVNITPNNLPTLNPYVRDKVLRSVVQISYSDAKYEYGGSGFFVKSSGNSHSEMQIVTAGHVLNHVNPDSVQVEATNGSIFGIAKYTSALYKPTAEELHKANNNQGLAAVLDRKEDLAIIDMKPADKKGAYALDTRPLDLYPLRPGEPLWFINFQRFRYPPDPAAIFTNIYAGDSSKNIGEALGNLMPGQEEDELRAGGSGGIAVDSLGRIVGETISSADDFYKCSRGILAETVRSARVKFYKLRIASDTGECKSGVSSESIRLVDGDGTFQFDPSNTRAPVFTSKTVTRQFVVG